MPAIIVKPANLKELWGTVSKLPPQRRYLAGGTDLMAAVNSGFESSVAWVDISGIKELKGIKEARDTIVIGAGTTISELGDSTIVKKWLPALAAAVPHFASPSLRNTATIGGNAANASPCADGVCALCAEGAFAILELRGKKRKVQLAKLFKGPKRTILKKDELVAAFEVPKREHSGVYLKLGPRAYFGISKAAVAVCLELEGDKVRAVSIALASVAPIPLMAVKTSAYLAGRILNAENARTAAALVKTEVSPITDHRSQESYRREMSAVLLERALNIIAGSK